MNPTVNEITSTAIGELRITVVYDNNPYKVGLTQFISHRLCR
jgi:hypothetical protein